MFDFELLSSSLESLISIGWHAGLNDAASDALTALDANDASTPPRLARVVTVHRETVQLHDGEREFAARVHPRLHAALATHDTALAVGDWVLVRDDAQAAAWVHARLAPQTHLVRRDADGRRHPLASNVDTALLVMGLDLDFSPRRLERFLALLAGSGVQPVVVLTKADLVAPSASEALAADEIDALHARVGPDVPVLAVNGTSPEAARQLAPWLVPGQTVVLLGSSGAGKSTLTNTLAGRTVQVTQQVREHDHRGQHTTTARVLHRLPGGACVIDTPGLRALRPDIDAAGLAASFGDIARLAPRCRFRDCRHNGEPGCAVREGVNEDRLRNFHKLQRELQRDTMTVLEKRELVAGWKARTRSVRAWMKTKRGEGDA